MTVKAYWTQHAINRLHERCPSIKDHLGLLESAVPFGPQRDHTQMYRSGEVVMLIDEKEGVVKTVLSEKQMLANCAAWGMKINLAATASQKPQEPIKRDPHGPLTKDEQEVLDALDEGLEVVYMTAGESPGKKKGFRLPSGRKCSGAVNRLLTRGLVRVVSVNFTLTVEMVK